MQRIREGAPATVRQLFAAGRWPSPTAADLADAEAYMTKRAMDRAERDAMIRARYAAEFVAIESEDLLDG